jgi:1L-myo-inositol 1-phosphate cytidylyltransferase / CDP-L-myo-inositol myo-inositolphosphotransferase
LIRRLRLSANAMSLFVLALGLYAGWLFGRGDYASGVAAAAISLGAGILDGCDGELARLQFKQSAFGCWLDTLGDYVYYLATFAGLTIGAVRASGNGAYWWLGGALGVGTLVTLALLIVLRHRTTDGHPERLNATTKAQFEAGKPWARLVARLATCATRAVMPYGVMAFALLGLLPVVLVLATIGAHVYWISLAVKLPALLPGGSRAGAGRPATDPARRVLRDIDGIDDGLGRRGGGLPRPS